jgi:hypothetical protein
MKIELTNEHLAVIGQALENMPFKMAAPVLQHLQREINIIQNAAQMQQPTEQGVQGNGTLQPET